MSPGFQTSQLYGDEQIDTDSDVTAKQETINLPTPHSLIDPLSFNRQGLPQLEALRQANNWFTGMLKVLEQRMRLGENMKDELGSLINSLENLVRVKQQIQGSGGQQIDSNEPLSDSDSSSDTSSVNIIVDDLQAPTTFREPKPAKNSNSTSSIEAPEFVNDMMNSLPANDHEMAVSLNQLEQEIMETLSKVQITRAKWNAGGRGLERWTGTR